MKKIGFVDYYLSEWHANNYPKWIAEANERLGTDYQVAYGWAELEVSPVTGESTDQWCEKFGAVRCDSIAELCEKSDAIILLAPSDPDKHLPYAEEILPFGKRTYIDKTFAPDHETAKAIFELAKQHGTPFFSTSALRYASELEAFKGMDNLTLTGGGSNFAEYIIHIVEMAVILLDDPVTSVRVERGGCAGKAEAQTTEGVCSGEPDQNGADQRDERICRLFTENGKRMTIRFAPDLDYSIEYVNADGEPQVRKVTSKFFPDLIADMLKFFEDGKLPFDGGQTLEVMRMRDMLIQAEAMS